ncbi:MAG: bifunctional 4-hydroxy-2-oxoglutarate aldolase/2-dehydro-3-deoxy-phosphogluconate aldolase [Lachnospiraceae bacterium]|nr:bifunctional 4-hydroxy-2-oxoglutarate aldolase/2-dehydro-3-deoxy-phosphogluconate aldolase [Lachnospiraceae bacterium]
MKREEIIGKIYEDKVIAIVRGIGSEPLLKLANALYAGGITMMEITFDQARPETWDTTAASIAFLRAQVGDHMAIGAGTVTSSYLVEKAVSAGAEYIISPDVQKEVIEKTKEMGAVSIPGAMTPTEVIAAYKYGADFVKIFPAANLGQKYIKALRGPINHIPLLAVGGVNEDNLKDFLEVGMIGAGVGGNLVNKKWIEEGEFDKITELARKYRCAAGNC